MIAVDGGTVWAEETGSGAKTLVLLHPGVGDSTIWDPVMPMLPGYRIIRYDARGHRRSPAATRQYTLLADLIAVLDKLSVDAATMVGCSQGGDASMQLAIEQPRRVSALVLVSPGLTGYPMPEDPEVRAEAGRLYAQRDVEGMAQLGLRMWAAAGHDEAATAQLRSAAKAWLDNGGYEQEGPAAFGRLAEIAAPSAILAGDRDYPPIFGCFDAIASSIPDCIRIDVPGGDHLLPLRVPALIAQTIERLAR